MSNDNVIPTNIDQSQGIGDNLELGALVASGDCFVTLATQLDELSRSNLSTEEMRSQLEAITRALMDLQRQYSIVKK